MVYIARNALTDLGHREAGPSRPRAPLSGSGARLSAILSAAEAWFGEASDAEVIYCEETAARHSTGRQVGKVLLRHRSHIENVEFRSAKHHAGDVFDRHLDYSLDLAVRRVADQLDLLAAFLFRGPVRQLHFVSQRPRDLAEARPANRARSGTLHFAQC
jgi:hypothetical protein